MKVSFLHTKFMSVAKKMDEVWNLHQKIIVAIRYESRELQPIKTDVAEIPLIFEKFNRVCNPSNKDNINIFICCIVYMYCPLSFIKGRIIYGKVRKEIANILNVSSSAVSKKFVIIKSLIFNHKGFCAEVDRVFELLTE